MAHTGTYTRSTETFQLKDAMAVAVAVDRVQGFVKAGKESYDPATDTHTLNNRVIALDTLRQMASVTSSPVKFVSGVPAQICLPTDDDYIAAGPVFTYFDEQVVMSKLAGEVVVNGAPLVSAVFNFNLTSIFTSGIVDTGRELGMIVSLPHCHRIAAKRVIMSDFNNANSNNGYISEIKRRLDITGKVMDIKLIPHQKLNLVTVLTSENKIAKFFMSEARYESIRGLDGKEIAFVGTVKNQDVNTYTGCQETVFNRVVIK
jgi:hypothetical protein